MTNKRKIMVLALALLVMTWDGAWAQPNCINALMSLAPCLEYLTGGSLGPSSWCCSELNLVIQNQPECPCALVNIGGAALGIVANQTLALTIPTACNLEDPSVSQCNFVSGRTTESVDSRASAPRGSQSSSYTPSDISSNDSPYSETVPRNSSSPGSGYKTVSSTNNTSSGASVTKSPFCVALLLLLVLHFSDSVLSLRYRNQ